jgi:hypothetical protein
MRPAWLCCEPRVAAHLETLEPPALKAGELRDAIEAVLEPASASVLAEVSIGLGATARHHNLDATALSEALTDELSKKWNKEELDEWQKIRSPFEDLLNARSVVLIAKAIQLSYDYANFYEKGRILTDIRPLFDEDSLRIPAALVSQVLRIDYVNEEGRHSISLAMDESDVERLRRACERALRKGEACEEVAEKESGIRVVRSEELKQWP